MTSIYIILGSVFIYLFFAFLSAQTNKVRLKSQFKKTPISEEECLKRDEENSRKRREFEDKRSSERWDEIEEYRHMSGYYDDLNNKI